MESTILISRDNQWSIIRLDALSPMAFEPILGHLPPVFDKAPDENQPLCPGQMHRHYAPQARLTLVRELPNDAKGIVLGYFERTYPIPAFFLGSFSNSEQVAHNLYAALRRLDQEGITHAWVDIDVPSTRLWLTIVERLVRAAQS